MVKLFVDGGWAMWPLLFLLMMGIGFAIERLYTLSRAAIDADALFQILEEAMRSGGFITRANHCPPTHGPVGS